MAISPVSFSSNIQTEKQTGGASKAVASAIVPGLGQFLDGRNKEGAAYLGGNVGITVASTLVANSMIKGFAKSIEQGAETMPKTSAGKIGAMALLTIAGTALWISNIVDAYKGEKQETNASAEKTNELDANA